MFQKLITPGFLAELMLALSFFAHQCHYESLKLCKNDTVGAEIEKKKGLFIWK